MRCANSVPAPFFLVALLTPAAAFAPLQRRNDERSWTPAKETGRFEDRIGWTPKPTGAPVPPPRYGEMDLVRRGGFSMGTDTCGFVSGFSSAPVTCVRQSAYCTNDGVGNMDCCTGEYSLCTASMYSSCINYSSSQNGVCDGKGLRTICCWSESPSCYTLIYSTTASPGKKFSILQCQASGGSDILLATPPNFTLTSSSSRPSSTPYSTTPATTTSGGGGGSSGSNNGGNNTNAENSTPVGAIVGGVVGGVAAVGLIGFLIFWAIIHSRRKNLQPTYAPVAQPPPGPDIVHTPQAPFPSPGQQYSPFAQQPQQPFGHAADWNKPQATTQFNSDTATGFPPPMPHGQPGYGGHGDPFATGQQLGYASAVGPAPMQSQGYAMQGYAPQQQYPYQQQGPVNELPVQHAFGTAGQRAELGH
ncbi:hypothetical protein OQA88_13343 [Cercophora sp. LCS_1]